MVSQGVLQARMVRIYEGTSSGTKKEGLPRLLRKSIYYNARMGDHLFSETMLPGLATGAANDLFVSR